MAPHWFARPNRRSTTWNRTRALWPSLIGALILRDRGTCAYCGVDLVGAAFQIDHVRPEPRGMRKNDPRNLVCTCDECNLAKGNGPVLASARREVKNRTRRVLDYEAGRTRAEELYPWHRARMERRNAKRRKTYTPEAVSFDPSNF